MDVWRLWMSCVLLAGEDHSVSGLTIGGCEQGSVDVTEDTDPSFTCSSSSSHQLEWKVYSEQEKELYSASCNGWTCTPSNYRFGLFIRVFNSEDYTSGLVIKGITRESARRLVCIVSSERAECTLRVTGLTIGGCKEGRADVTNGSDPSFTCTTSWSYTLTWTVYNEEGEQIFSESCNKWNCWSTNKRFNLLVNDSPGGFTSELVIKEITKDFARRLVCVALSGQAECSLRFIEKEQEKDSNGKGGIIGGVVTAVIVIAIIATIITVYTVKHRKGMFFRGRFTLNIWNRIFKFCQRRKSPPSVVVTKPIRQTPIKRFAAPTGDLYTLALSTTSGGVSDEPSTIYEPIENTMLGTYENYNPTRSKAVCEGTGGKAAANPTKKFKPSTASTLKKQDTLDTVYMNVTQVPTDSGSGDYYNVPRLTIHARREADTRDKCATALSDSNYNVLRFEEDHSKQQIHNATYHHIQRD